MVLGGLGRLVRTYPHIPGIDLAGTVEDSSAAEFKPGDAVVLTGWRVGEIHWGGYATRARVEAGWLVPLPDGLSLKQAMAIGTAGLTAMLAVMALEDHGLAAGGDNEVLVTGAGGGVGSIAVALLANLGFPVAASTGRAETADYLKGLGARSIVGRAELEAPPKGPLGSERWAGAIDNVGGAILANLLATLRYSGCCASVGLAAGSGLETTVLPFLLRGISLIGINSSTCPAPTRRIAWDRLARELPLDKLDGMTASITLDKVAEMGGKILRGEVRGRTVVDLQG